MTTRKGSYWTRIAWREYISALALALCTGACCAFPHQLRAQRAPALSQLDGRVSSSLKRVIVVLTDSAAAAGLPVAPLVDKALEGASKHADDARIIAAVRTVMTDLGIARNSLGSVASESELTAGVAAIRAGVSPAALASFRRSLPHRPLTVPLSILGALVMEGAPVASAATTVVNYARRGDDEQLLIFGQDVARSIASGVPAEAALSRPVGAATSSLPPTNQSAPSSTPRPRTKP